MSIALGDVRELVSYNAETGTFTWNKTRPYCTVGKPAGGLTPYGYVRIVLCGRPYQAHRLAWFYTYGRWPSHEIDHINGVRDDNRLANLREATPSQNQANKAMRSDNTSGIKGVSWDRSRGKWHASINVSGRMKNLGRFQKIEDAASAYADAAMKFHGEFARPERNVNV